MTASSQTTRELLPCPFCGNDGSGPIEHTLHIAHTQNNWHPAYDCYSVQCDKCTANMGYSASEDEAAEAWNQRSPTPQQGVERMREAIGNAISTRERDATDEYTKGFNNGLRAAEVIVLEVLSTDLHMGGAGETVEHPRDPSRPAYGIAMSDLMDAYEQRVWVWAQGCYIDDITQRSQVGDSYNEGQRDDVAKARRELLWLVDEISQPKSSEGDEANASDEGEGA